MINYYMRSQVGAIEATEDFRQAMATATRRKKSAAKGVDTKADRLLDYVDSLDIDVPLLTADELLRQACDHYNYGSDKEFWASPESDLKFLVRIKVNFLRHELTRYETQLAAIAGKVGCNWAYLDLKRKVLHSIASTYPDLADECERQVSNMPDL